MNPINDELERINAELNACPCPGDDPCSKCVTRAAQLGHIIDAIKELTDD